MTPQPDGTEEQGTQGTTEESGSTETPPEESGNPPADEGTGDEGKETPEAKHTDADLDHHKGQARKEGRNAVLKALGFKKLEDAQAFVNQQREGETRADEVLATANRRIVLADAREIASEIGVKKNRVDDVVKEFVDLSDIEVDEDGEADRETVRTRIAEFTTKYPEFLKSSAGKSPGEKENPPAPQGIDADIAEAVEAGNFVLAEALRAQKLSQGKK